MTKLYTTWNQTETQVYDQLCGNKKETDSDSNRSFSKTPGSGFVMDAPGCELDLFADHYPVYWPVTPDDPEQLSDVLTEFGIFDGTFNVYAKLGMGLGEGRPFRLTLQRNGVMKVNVVSRLLSSVKNNNGSTHVNMYDNSMLEWHCSSFMWGGGYSAYDNAVMNISTDTFILPVDFVATLYGDSELNLKTDRINVTSDPWSISLEEKTPRLNIMSSSDKGDPLQSGDADARYPQGIINFSSATRGTVVIDTPTKGANKYTLTNLNDRKTFAVNGQPYDVNDGGLFSVRYDNNVQRDGFTTSTITITKVR